VVGGVVVGVVVGGVVVGGVVVGGVVGFVVGVVAFVVGVVTFLGVVVLVDVVLVVVDLAGPVETVRAMEELAGTAVPAAGLVLITKPLATVGEWVSVSSFTAKPAA
jgi:hypothetical protein